MDIRPRDLALVYTVRSVRAFGFGAMGVLLALYLPRFGLGPFALGLYLSAATLAGLTWNALLMARVDRIGRRRVLLIGSLLYVVGGLALALAQGPVLLVAAVLTGTLPPGGDGLFSTAEQAVIGNVASERRPSVFGRYGLVGSIASSAGLLAAALPAVVASHGVAAFTAERWAMAAYALAGAAMALAVLGLGAGVEGDPRRRAGAGAAGAAVRPDRFGFGLGRSRRLLLSMAALFVADSFGSAMVTTTLLTYWLHARFGLGAVALSAILFAMRAAATVSYPLAVRLGRRFGMIETAVWSHIPSSLLLMALPLSGGLAGAGALLVARGLLVEMDVPTRQAFISAQVDPEERAAAAGVTTLGRQVGQLAGPMAGGLALTLAAPVLFVVAGAVKIAYDLALWRLCKDVPALSSETATG